MPNAATKVETGPDAELISDLRTGKEDSYERLLNLYGGQLLAVARRFMHSDQDSQDVFQEAILKAFLNIDSFRGDTNIYGWLYRICINICLERLRKGKRAGEILIDSMQPVFDARDCRIGERLVRPRSPEELLANVQTREQVRAAVDKLPESYRMVLLLRDIEEHSTRETAELLEIEEGAVKTRLHRARAALKKILEPMMLGDATNEEVKP